MTPLFQRNFSARQRYTPPVQPSVQSVVYLLSRFSGLIALVLNAELKPQISQMTQIRGGKTAVVLTTLLFQRNFSPVSSKLLSFSHL